MSKPATPRVITALLPATAPAAVQRVSAPAAAPAVEAAPAPGNDVDATVVKAAPKKKKAKAVQPSDTDVPY
jgi:hypothetical protein